jgi:hypothetical protein
VKIFSQPVSDALNSGEIRPVWLLQIDLVRGSESTTLRFSDRPITLWGADWKPAVLDWGVVDRYFDPALGESQVSDMTVTLSNEPDITGSGEPGVSYSLRRYDLGCSVATIYLWLDGAGLTPPSGQNQNDLITILTGTPEITSGITPRVCPLDIVSKAASITGDMAGLDDILSGKYTKNQWPALQSSLVGGWKPAVFGNDMVVSGVALSLAQRVGKINGPDALFDPATGANYVLITFDSSQQTPYPAPCDIYLGDYKLTVKDPPVDNGATGWMYNIYSPVGGSKFYVPSPMIGGEPLFSPSPNALWPRSDESGAGPYASSEPPQGVPYQFYHGPSDAGNSADGYNVGMPNRSIKEVYVNGVKAPESEAVADDGFGIAWLRTGSSSVRSAVGGPVSTRLKYTAVDDSHTTGSAYLRPEQLTASWPYGYNAGTNPCILGDFSVPASGGGAPSSTQLGLINSVRYPSVGSRIASVRFVMKYTGLEVAAGTFNVTVFGSNYSFAASQLDDGAQIAGDGWWVTRDQKGPQFEIWPNNNGHPYTLTSPDPRYWDIYELSRDVTTEALAHVKSNGGFADSFRAWFTSSQWPDTNSLMVLAVELEVTYDAVESALDEPSVTALIGGPSLDAGDIIQELLPAELVGDGFNDSALPDLKYRVETQQSASSFIDTVAKEAGYELKMNDSTGKWDLLALSSSQDSLNPPPPTGGAADISQDALLADDTGAPMIMRSRPAPERIVNEVTVEFTTPSGSSDSVTVQDVSSIGIYGVQSMSAQFSAVALSDVAEAYALEVLNYNSDVADFYRFTLPLGPALSLAPNDILRVTASMDSLSSTKMRVVSVSLDMGNIAEEKIAAVTVNAKRYFKVSNGYGMTQFGQSPYGLGQIMEN